MKPLDEVLVDLRKQAIENLKRIDPSFAQECLDSAAEFAASEKERAAVEHAREEAARKVHSKEHEALRQMAEFNKNRSLVKSAGDQLNEFQKHADFDPQTKYPAAWNRALDLLRDGKTYIEVLDILESIFGGIDHVERKKVAASANSYWAQLLTLAWEGCLRVAAEGWTAHEISKRLIEGETHFHPFDADRMAFKAIAEIEFRRKQERGE